MSKIISGTQETRIAISIDIEGVLSEKEIKSIFEMEGVEEVNQAITGTVIVFKIEGYPDLKKYVKECEEQVLKALKNSKEKYKELEDEIMDRIGGNYKTGEDIIEAIELIIYETREFNELKITMDQEYKSNGEDKKIIGLEDSESADIIMKLQVENENSKHQYDSPLEEIEDKWNLKKIKRTRHIIDNAIEDGEKYKEKEGKKEYKERQTAAKGLSDIYG